MRHQILHVIAFYAARTLPTGQSMNIVVPAAMWADSMKHAKGIATTAVQAAYPTIYGWYSQSATISDTTVTIDWSEKDTASIPTDDDQIKTLIQLLNKAMDNSIPKPL